MTGINGTDRNQNSVASHCGSGPEALSTGCVLMVWVVRDSRSVSVDPDGVDAALGEAAALQEGTVVADVHALTGEVAGLEQLDAVVLSMLGTQSRRVSLHTSGTLLPEGFRGPSSSRRSPCGWACRTPCGRCGSSTSGTLGILRAPGCTAAP